MKSAISIKITQCLSSDLNALRNISLSTFIASYRHKNEPSVFNAYIKKAFALGQLKEEFQTKGSYFYLVHFDDELIGYLKLNIAPAQSDINDPNSLEIERIYLIKEFQGKGIGKQLIDFAVGQAALHSKTKIWLGVWTKNPQAVAFYNKMGFDITGTHSFVIGGEAQDDHVMERKI